MGTQVHFTRLGMSLPCPVPVLPGTPDTMRDGEAIPMAERTEACAVDAYWMIGAQVICDVHLREACDLLDIDFDGVVAEGGGFADGARESWFERHRYDQDAAQFGETWERRS